MFKGNRAFIAALVCCGVFSAYAIPASAVTTIGAPPQPNPWVGGYLNCPWGYATSTTIGAVAFGETFVVPNTTDTVLDSVSLYVTQLRNSSGLLVGEPRTITYKAYVGKWDGQTVTEPVWASAPQTVTTSPEVAKVTVPTGGVPLALGQEYALYFSTEETTAQNTTADRGCGVNSSGNTYAAGGSLLRVLGVSNTNWQWGAPQFGSHDAAFSASFSAPIPVPDPGEQEAPSITVAQSCIDPGSPETGGGLVSGSYTGAPTGADVDVYANRFAGAFAENFGVDADPEADGTFSFNLSRYYTDAELPDTLWIAAFYWDGFQRQLLDEVEVPVCVPEPDPDADNDGVVDAVDNCDNDVNPGQENDDVDAEGDACDADDDNDGVNDGGDNCQFTANPLQRDDDQDGIGDACDGTFDSSNGKSSGGGWLTTSDGRVNFSSSAKSVDGVMAGNCTVTIGQTKIKCLTVDGYYQSPTNDRAVFVGSATQDGVATRYRIELTDSSEPGTSDRIEITTDAGFAAAGVIGGGNLQVHFGV